MSDTSHTPRFHADRTRLMPGTMVKAMTVMVLIVLALTTLSVVTGREAGSTPPVGDVKRAVSLHLSSDMSGAARVLDASGTLIADLAPEKGGFVAGVDRVIRFERGKAGLPEDGPVRLEAYTNGRMAIIDPVSGWRADLMGFGADNAAAFARLLAYDSGTPARSSDPLAVQN